MFHIHHGFLGSALIADIDIRMAAEGGGMNRLFHRCTTASGATAKRQFIIALKFGVLLQKDFAFFIKHFHTSRKHTVQEFLAVSKFKEINTNTVIVPCVFLAFLINPNGSIRGDPNIFKQIIINKQGVYCLIE